MAAVEELMAAVAAVEKSATATVAVAITSGCDCCLL